MECVGLPQIEYEAFRDLLFQKLADQRIPISGSLEVTERCNLRCQHCYLPLTSQSGSQEAELSLEEIERIFDEITEAGCLWLLLTGGEPFLRKDFLPIYQSAKHHGLIVSLFTNGTLITPQIASTLAEWRPFNIEITVYGYTQETYERVTGVPGSYARFRRGIDLLLEHELPLELKTVLMTLNAHELPRMQQFAEDLGVKFRFDPILNAALDGSPRPVKLRLSSREVVEIEKQDPGRSQRLPLYFQNLQSPDPSSQQLFLCAAGNQGFHIDSHGRLNLCLTARTPYYDLRQGSFQYGWTEVLPSFRQLNYSSHYACAGCELRLACPQCPAQSLLEHGNPEARIDYLCEITHLRQAAFAPSTPVSG
jgi:radical SAM protein with 4Fe4S-binding SPASM domain